MANSEYDSITGSRDRAKILGKSKYWPVITDSAEVGVGCIRKNAVVYELSAHDDVLTCLVGRRSSVLRELIRFSCFRGTSSRVRSSWNNEQPPLCDTTVNSTRTTRYSHQDELTHDEIIVFCIILLRLKHHLMSKDGTGRVTLPNDNLRIVARRNPLGTDVSVDAHCVPCAIRRRDLYSEVRKRSGLFYEVRGLASRT